jgi:transketolase
MRRTFADILLNLAKEDSSIIVISLDLGYKMWDEFRDTLPKQFYNLGAAEHAGLGVAVGLALGGKIPVVYSATSFLLYRGFEVVRNYINHESIPVKLAGSGRDRDYELDGFTHWAEDADEILGLFYNIASYWPQTKEDLQEWVPALIYSGIPEFISLRR